jgi:hypothetical protein
MGIQAKRTSEAAPRSNGEKLAVDRLHEVLQRARKQAKHAQLPRRPREGT